MAITKQKPLDNNSRRKKAMKRYKKYVFESENGKSFEFVKGAKGKVNIKVLENDQLAACSENYANPPVLEGYTHVLGTWLSGFVIRRTSDGSDFVWVPVGYLESTGTLDGIAWGEKFGRRNYSYDNFSQSGAHEEISKEYESQMESVRKYGGFYISRFNISRNEKTGNPQSVRGGKPWTKTSFNDAKIVAAGFEKSDMVTSHLTFGAEYDSVLEWIIKSGAKTYVEIVENSTDCGNYVNTAEATGEIIPTGSSEKNCINNIYDLAGNVDEWTQEMAENSSRIIRGGGCKAYGYLTPAANRRIGKPKEKYPDTGFRAVLCIK